MIHLSILDPNHGDFTHSWDPNDPEQVENARKLFDDLKKTGYMIYETQKTADGSNVTHDIVHTFDAVQGSYDFKDAEKQLTARPAAAGG